MVTKPTLQSGLNAINRAGGKMFYVVYEVDGFDGVHKAGPYPQSDIKYQRDDIAGFEGVKNVKVVPAEEIDE